MRFFLLCSLFTILNTAWAQEGWQPVAETSHCDEKIQILGKEGEKYVLAVQGSTQSKLYSKDGSTFTKDSMKNTEFLSEDFTFVQPSYVERNPPKIIISQNGKMKKCKMAFKTL